MESNGFKYNVLIVDDIFENANLISNIIRSGNYDIRIATGGKEAIAAVETQMPDLILLDIAMPEVDGYEVCRVLKNSDKTSDVPVIFITAKTLTEDIVKGFDFGAVDYITKPYNYQELNKRVATHLELKHSRDIIKQQNEELRELNNTKDRLFSIIAHDLLNPFNTLIGFAELLDSNYRDLDDGTRKEFIRYILNASEMGHGLLTNLLHWSRSQTGRLVFHPEKINLYTILVDNYNFINTFALKKGISIRLNAPKNCFVFVDENMITTVIRNLVSNSIKFTHEKGEILIDVVREDDKYKVSVKDTGIGIPESLIPNLFKLAPEVLRVGTNNEKGTGLGLVVCKDFVERHNGHIDVYSLNEKGTTISFYLDVYREKS